MFRHCRSCAHWKPHKKQRKEKEKETRRQEELMNLSRDKLSISEEPIFVFTRTDNCKEIVVTKVRGYYVSFGIHIDHLIISIGDTTFYAYTTLPRFFVLENTGIGEDTSTSGVEVIVIEDRQDCFYVENRLLVTVTGE